MFELFFQHPAAVFSKGQFALLSGWPVWLLILLIAAAAALLGWNLHRSASAAVSRPRRLVLWTLQSALAALLLFLLWQPALLVASLKPQQNVIAVVIDDSRSMAIAEKEGPRKDQVARLLSGGLLDRLRERFQVRLYRLGGNAERIDKLDQLSAAATASPLGEQLQQVAVDSTGLPLGAMVLLSDGADTTGGISRAAIAEIRGRRVPVHTVGVGRERYDKDIELLDADLPSRALPDARLAATVNLRQHGYAQQKARVSIKAGGKVLASQEITLGADDAAQTVTVPFNAGVAGARTLEVSVDPLAGEENTRNNMRSRLINVEDRKPRVLYLEGEPRWEFKFIRRAMEDERSVQLTTILRTTQNKTYRQGLKDPKDLEEGFPVRAEELFAYDALIIGTVELAWFTPSQQELIRSFVDRRGGGVLFLGGRSSFGEGGWARSPLSELIPVALPDRKGTFHRAPAAVELTAAGRDDLLTRIEEAPDRNAERWKKLPTLADYQELGPPRPGAVVLAELLPTSRGRLPLLATQNFGRGRTAVLATGGTWRWQMSQPLEDLSHERFWQQMLRWLVADAPSHVTAAMPRQVLSDEKHVRLRAEVRDKSYQAVADAKVEARILGPEGLSAQVEMVPDPAAPGAYTLEWEAPKPGSYLTEVIARRGETDLGRDTFTFLREEGVAENFGTQQNRELLTRLSAETGGSYYPISDAARLSTDINYSEAGLSVREAKDLWSMPIVFLLIIGLRAAEWLLRRRWGRV